MPTLPKSKRPYWLPERKAAGWSKSPNAKKYKTKAWERLALAHKRDNPLCVECLKQGIRAPVEVTDHVKALRDGGAFLDWNNLQSLCRPCHLRKTNEETKARAAGGGRGSRGANDP